MKTITIFLLLAATVMSFVGCSQGEGNNQEIVAHINDYSLHIDDFQYQLASAMKFDPEFELTSDNKEIFLDEVIRKELLIQEAKKLNLDQKKEFILAIERYWESTLIRDLMNLKGEEISEKTVVSEEEITQYYQRMPESTTTPVPSPELKGVIRKSIMEEKKSRIMQEWMDVLRKNANIKINHALLER